jgi:hypothetical protein
VLLHGRGNLRGDRLGTGPRFERAGARRGLHRWISSLGCGGDSRGGAGGLRAGRRAERC